MSSGGGWATGVAADSRLVAKAEGEREVAAVVAAAAAAAAANIKSLAHAWCIH